MTPEAYADAVGSYRRLVTAEATRESLEKSLDLVESVIGLSLAESFPYQVVSDASIDAALVRDGSVDEYMEDVAAGMELMKRRRDSYVKLQRLAVRAEFSLHMPMVVSRGSPIPLSEREHSLLLDVALVVFHQAYFWLWDAMPPAFAPERERLLRAFRGFSEAMAHAEDIADALRITGLVLWKEGDSEKAAWYFREAVRRTSPASHEFMSVLQLAWAFLVDHGRFHDAMALLADHMTRIPHSDLQEFRTLLVSTVARARGRFDYG